MCNIAWIWNFEVQINVYINKDKKSPIYMEKMADVLIVGPKERTEMVNSVNVRFCCVTDDDWKASNFKHS